VYSDGTATNKFLTAVGAVLLEQLAAAGGLRIGPVTLSLADCVSVASLKPTDPAAELQQSASAEIEKHCAELGPTLAPAGAVLAAALLAEWSRWDGVRQPDKNVGLCYLKLAPKMSAVIVKLLQKSAAGQQQQQQHLCITLQHVRAAVKGVYASTSSSNATVAAVVAVLLEQLAAAGGFRVGPVTLSLAACVSVASLKHTGAAAELQQAASALPGILSY
jgi:hypothetical protein